MNANNIAKILKIYGVRMYTAVANVTKSIVYNFLKFLHQNWRSYVIDISSGLIVAGITTLILVHVFRTPNFELNLSSHIQTDGSEVLAVNVYNNKHYLAFEERAVGFHIFIPDQVMQGKEIYVHTPLQGPQKAEIASITKNESRASDGMKYFTGRSQINEYVRPRSAVRILSIIGKFDRTQEFPVCLYFSTPYGTYPRWINVDPDGMILVNPNKLICKTYTFPK